MRGGDLQETCIVLAGGTGTRLRGVTGGGNKHLVPVAGRPALAHVLAPIRNSCGTGPGALVTGPDFVEPMAEVLREAGLGHWPVCVQDRPDGTLSAIRCAIQHVATPSFTVHLGDNLFSWDQLPAASPAFAAGAAVELFVKEVPAADSERFAVVTIESGHASGRVLSVIEKPPTGGPLAAYRALTGFARFDTGAFTKSAPRVERSPRGEFEVTSLMDLYLHEGMAVTAQEVGHAWLDYGTEYSLREAENILRQRKEQP